MQTSLTCNTFSCSFCSLGNGCPSLCQRWLLAGRNQRQMWGLNREVAPSFISGWLESRRGNSSYFCLSRSSGDDSRSLQSFCSGHCQLLDISHSNSISFSTSTHLCCCSAQPLFWPYFGAGDPVDGPFLSQHCRSNSSFSEIRPSNSLYAGHYVS